MPGQGDNASVDVHPGTRMYKRIVLDDLFKEIGWGKYHRMVLFLCAMGTWAHEPELLLIALVMSSVKKYYGISSMTYALVPIAAGFGVILGHFLGGMFSNKYGRRVPFIWSLFGCGIFMVLSATIFSQISWWVWLFFRFMINFFIGVSASVSEVYYAEHTSAHYRKEYKYVHFYYGPLILLYTCILAITGMKWDLLLLLSSFPTLFGWLIRDMFTTETPVRLVKNGQVDEAYNLLTKIAMWDNKHELSISKEKFIMYNSDGGFCAMRSRSTSVVQVYEHTNPIETVEGEQDEEEIAAVVNGLEKKAAAEEVAVSKDEDKVVNFAENAYVAAAAENSALKFDLSLDHHHFNASHSAALAHLHAHDATYPLVLIWLLQATAHWGLTVFVAAYFNQSGIIDQFLDHLNLTMLIVCAGLFGLPVLYVFQRTDHLKVLRIFSLFQCFFCGMWLFSNAIDNKYPILVGIGSSGFYGCLVPLWSILGLYIHEAYPRQLRGLVGRLLTITRNGASLVVLFSAYLIDLNKPFFYVLPFFVLTAINFIYCEFFLHRHVYPRENPHNRLHYGQFTVADLEKAIKH